MSKLISCCDVFEDSAVSSLTAGAAFILCPFPIVSSISTTDPDLNILDSSLLPDTVISIGDKATTIIGRGSISPSVSIYLLVSSPPSSTSSRLLSMVMPPPRFVQWATDCAEEGK